MEVMPARALLTHTALAQKHIPARVGMLPEGTLAVVGPLRTRFIFVFLPKGSIPRFIPMPATTRRARKADGITMALSMLGLVRILDIIRSWWVGNL